MTTCDRCGREVTAGADGRWHAPELHPRDAYYCTAQGGPAATQHLVDGRHLAFSYYADGIAQMVDTDPREYVPVDEIRAAYQALDREALDRLLVEVAGSADYEAVPESNQKALTAEQRAGALWIGGQHKHYLTRVSGF